MMKKTCKIILSSLMSLVLVAIMIAVIPALMSSTDAQAAEAEISIRCESTDVSYGETVTLTADMDSELASSSWVWEAGSGETWNVVQEGGLSYEFVADSSNTELEYRVVVMGA